MSRVRFDYLLLSPEDPFEIDNGNRPHLHKRLLTDDTGRYISVDTGDIYDAYWYGDPSFYEADEVGAADWLMLAYVAGVPVICVPVAPPRSGDRTKCRPIGLYKASKEDRARYWRHEGYE